MTGSKVVARWSSVQHFGHGLTCWTSPFVAFIGCIYRLIKDRRRPCSVLPRWPKLAAECRVCDASSELTSGRLSVLVAILSSSTTRSHLRGVSIYLIFFPVNLRLALHLMQPPLYDFTISISSPFSGLLFPFPVLFSFSSHQNPKSKTRAMT